MMRVWFMSLKKYATPLRLELQPSFTLLVLLSVMYGGAALILLSISFYWPLGTLLFVVVLYSLYMQLRLHLWMNSPKSVVALVWMEENGWKIFDRDGKSIDATLSGQSYLHAKLVVLKFKTEMEEQRVAIIFADSVTAEAHRKLRVRLSLQSHS